MVNPERLGLAGNWNRCLERAATPWVAIFHQDDLMRPGHLAGHLGAIGGHPGAGMICGAVAVVDERGEAVPAGVVERPELGPDDREYRPGAFLEELAARNPVRCSAVTLRKEAVEAVGGFDPGYRYAVDWECWGRIARRWPVVWRAEPTVAVRWHPESETHRFKAGTDDLDEVARVIERIRAEAFADRAGAERSRRLADRSLARAYLNRCHDALRAGDRSLAGRCLRRAVVLHPAIVGAIARDPRLAARLVASGVVFGAGSNGHRGPSP